MREVEKHTRSDKQGEILKLDGDKRSFGENYPSRAGKHASAKRERIKNGGDSAVGAQILLRQQLYQAQAEIGSDSHKHKAIAHPSTSTSRVPLFPNKPVVRAEEDKESYRIVHANPIVGGDTAGA
jgi:hypothetical protein